MDIADFKALKEGKKKSHDRFVRKYQQAYQIRQILVHDD